VESHGRAQCGHRCLATHARSYRGSRRHAQRAAAILHRALPYDAASQRHQRRRRALPRFRRRRAPRASGACGIRKLFGLGHLPYRNSADRAARARSGERHGTVARRRVRAERLAAAVARRESTEQRHGWRFGRSGDRRRLRVRRTRFRHAHGAASDDQGRNRHHECAGLRLVSRAAAVTAVSGTGLHSQLLHDVGLAGSQRRLGDARIRARRRLDCGVRARDRRPCRIRAVPTALGELGHALRHTNRVDRAPHGRWRIRAYDDRRIRSERLSRRERRAVHLDGTPRSSRSRARHGRPDGCHR